MKSCNKIEFWRRKIDKITEKLIRLIVQRKRIVLEIGRIKKEKNLRAVDFKREKELIKMAREMAKKSGISPILVEKIMKILIKDARELQNK